jgi:hypothetical protein
MNKLGSLDRFCGVPIIENSCLPEFTPVLELKLDTPVTDEFRANFNQWLVDMFGSNRSIYMMNGNILAHPNNRIFIELKLREYLA